jgi:hypothetical protein
MQRASPACRASFPRLSLGPVSFFVGAGSVPVVPLVDVGRERGRRGCPPTPFAAIRRVCAGRS